MEELHLVADKPTDEEGKELGAKGWKTIEFLSDKPTAYVATREKGKHIRKTSDKQKKELIRYFEANPNYVHIVAGTMGDNAMKNKIWASVAKRLNDIKGGVVKSPAKWNKSWADMKVYTKARAKAAIAGTAPVNSRRPTDLDRRILTVIGQDELLTNWDAALANDNGAQNSRQPILEHDYQVSGYQEDSEIVEEEYAEQHTEQRHVIVKELSEVRKQLKDEQEVDTLEFYIDEETDEMAVDETNEILEEVIAPQPPQKWPRFSKGESHQNMPQVIEVEEKEVDPVAEAIMSLADAMNNVASAIYTAADTIRLLRR